MRTIFVLLLCVATARAVTHVNISIAQQPATNPADVTYLDGTAPAELKAGPAKKANGEERSARLRAAEESDNEGGVQKNNSEQKEDTSSFNRDSSQAQQTQQATEQSNGFKPHQQQRVYGRMRQSNRPSRVRQANTQDKQNQEFERYIQNYHSGPTVETVFETADHSPSARYEYSSSSSSSSGPARLVAIDAKPQRQQQHTFERQVALPAASAPAEEPSKSAPDAKIQILPASVAAPTAAASPITLQASSPAAVQSAPSAVPSTSSKTVTTIISSGSDGGKVGVGGSFGSNFGGPSAGSSNGVTFRVAGGGGYSQPNFVGYGKPDYAQPSHNYNNEDAGGYLDEYPPSVDEPAGSYDDYYGGQENDYHSNGGYINSPPVYHRPLVTKTIQIAQPALKAKKFEVRHPAIQKEFYDIEERVVIKPAGTIVVELEHPVAKIAKGETVLPLGHPHPAIAAQYNINSDADIETESSSSGSYNNGVRSSSKQVYASAPRKQSAQVIGDTNIGSTLTATPTNNQNAKRDFVEANLRRQYGEEVKLLTTTESVLREQKQRAKDLHIPTDNQGSQRQMSNRNYSPNTFRREESNYQRPARVELKTNDEPYHAKLSKNDEQALQNNDREFQGSYSNSDDDYRAEYITGNFYSAVNRDPKPARLQEELQKSERITDEPRPQIIKHEHTIRLPPSQHNIYIAPSRFEERPLLIQEQRKQAASRKQQPARLEEASAQVQEIKPFLDRKREGGVVYVVPARRPVAAQQRYTQNERRQPQLVAQQPQQRTYGQLRYDPDVDFDAAVEYSPPYSHMRFDPKESARLTADVEHNRNLNENAPQRTVTVTYNRGPESNARLVAQNQSEPDVSTNSVQSTEDSQAGLHPLAHIQLQVPYGSQEADEPIRVLSSISPPKEHGRTAYARQSTAKQTFDDQVEQINAEPTAVQSDNQQQDTLHAENVKSQPDCTEKGRARYENHQQNEDDNVQYADDEIGKEPVKSLRLIDASESTTNSKDNPKSGASNIQAESVNANVKDVSAHATPPGSRVIAANPAPNDASATSESFHKRRIVVNHPFQTVREVVEHEPITNYHQIQVHEPASPTSAYNKAPYFAPNGALRQIETLRFGNLVYALPDAIPVHENTGEVEPSYQQRRQRVHA